MRYVGKYLYYLNTSAVEEGKLLEPTPVQDYLSVVQERGVGSCGVLHRILANKAAVRFMRMTVSTFAFVLKLQFYTTFPQR